MVLHQPCVFILGPTGTGKSGLALSLAQRHNGVIINFDSVQFYQGLEVGSAAPTAQEKKSVPHFLYSYVKAPKEMTAGEFLRDLSQVATQIPDDKVIFFVGGTGFYQQALEKGMFDVAEVDPQIKRQIIDEFERGLEQQLFEELTIFDPEHGHHINDHYRVGRALELKRAFNLRAGDIKNRVPKKIVELKQFIKLGVDLDKDILKKRIILRVEQMIESGLIDETQAQIEAGFADWSPLNSVGFKETKDYLNGTISRMDLQNQIVQSTTKLIKKQRTWFKRDSAVLWSTTTDLPSEVEQFLR
jgi:tRNA dimethylallyltransferase